MANNEETTTRFKVDISELKAQFQEAQRSIRLVNSEFKSATAGMDDWAKTSDGLSAKIKQMNGVLDGEKSKLQSLKDQYALVVQQEGANSKSAQELAIKINNQEAVVKSTEKELKNYQEKLKNLGTEEASKKLEGISNIFKKVGTSVKDFAKSGLETAGKTIKEFANNSVSKATNGLKSLGEQAKSTANDGFSTLKGAISTFVGNTLSNLVGKLGEAVSSLWNLSDETREFRDQMNKLNASAKDGGYSVEYASDTFKDFYKILGDDVASNTTTSNLLATGMAVEDLNKVTKSMIGVWGKFGDSIPLDGLAESINETAKVGQITGNLADALNWAGINEDDFNILLSECSDEQERQSLIANTLSKTYSNLADSYMENNASIMDANEVQLEYTENLATLGAKIEPVKTAIKRNTNEMLSAFIEFVDKIDFNDVFSKISAFKDNIKNTITNNVVPIWDILKNKISSVIDTIKGKLPEINKKVADFKAKFIEIKDVVIKEVVPNVVDKFNEFKDRFIVVKNNIVQAISTYILPVFSQLKQTCKQIFESLKNAIKGTSEPLISFKDVLSTAINVILPITRDIIIGLVDVIGNFITLIIDNKEVVSAIIIGIGTAFLTWNVITMIQGLGTAISTLPVILSAVKVAMAGLNATISANPVGIIIALIAGVIAYLVHLYNTSDEFRMLVDTIWQKIKEFWSEFSKNWAIGVDMIVEFFTKTIPDAWNKFKDDWATGMAIIVEWITIKVPQFFKDCWQSIKDTFSNVGNWFKDTFETAWENVKNVFASWGEFFSDLWDRIKDTFINLGTELGDAIGGTVKSAINGVIDGIESTINSGVDLINGAIDLINNIPGVSIGYMGGLNLPRLAKGGIVNNPILAQIGEQGKEAVVPLENNLGWIKNLANQLAIKINQGTGFNNSTSSHVTNNFYQTNNSPKALSRLEIYRQSKNLLSLKGA